MLEVENKAEQLEGAPNLRSRWLILKFLALWIGSLLVLALVGLTVDINWTRPRVEAALGQTLHRKIKLGQLRWHLGLNGLMIFTRSLNISELDGDPFLNAHGSNIGLALVPLLTGKLVIKHLQIDHPEIYAVKLKPGGWNFEDLFDPKTTVSFMQVDSGKVHVIDATKDAVFKDNFDLNDVNVKFNWPRKGRPLPLFVSCSIVDVGDKLPSVPTGAFNTIAAVSSVPAQGPASTVATPQGSIVSTTQGSNVSTPQDAAKNAVKNVAAKVVEKVVEKAAETVAATPSQAGATLEIDGLSTTKDKLLRDTVYDVNCKLTDMPSTSLNKLMSILMDDPNVKKSFVPDPKVANVSGTISLAAKLKGSMTKGFTSDIKADFKDVVLSGPSIGQVSTDSVTGQGDVAISNDLIAWKNLNFKLGGMELKTRGDLKNWQTKNSTYTIGMSSKPVELATVSSALKFSGADKKGKEEEDKIMQIFKTISMSGKAFFDVTMTGDRDQAKLLTQLEAEGLPVSKLVDEIAPELAPVFIVSGVNKNAVVKGHFNSSGGRRVSIEKGIITIPDSSIKLDGEVDLLRDAIDIKFEVEDFPLKKAWENALKDEATRKKISSTLTDTNLRSIVVAGYVKAVGNIVRTKKGTSVSVVAKMRDGAISYNDNTLDTTGINGTVTLKDGVISIDGFRGNIGKGGYFKLAGKVLNFFQGTPFCLVDFNGTGVNFAHLGSVMNVFHLNFPAITEGHLTGTVKSLVIKITGSHNHPDVFFSAAPDDVSYQPPGLTRSLKAVSGNITFKNDTVKLENVGIVSHGNRLTTSMVIYNLTKKARLKDIHVKSDGIELGDIDYYLSSTVMPASLRKSYRDLLHTYEIRNLHGKIYGDVIVVPTAEDDLADLEGVIGCYSVGATVSKLNLPLERLAGTFAASGNRLLIQDLTGYIRSTQFEVNGWVKNYKTKDPNWKTELRANIAPNEFLDLVPALTQTISNGKLKINSAGPMALRSKVEGNNKRNEVTFSAHADADDHLRIATPVAVINQPHLQELNLDGSATLDQELLILHKTDLTLGDASLKTEGTWEWSQPDQPITMTVASNKPVPAKILLELVDPSFDSRNITGSIDGQVSLTGPLRHPIVTGKVSLDKVSHPDFGLFDLTGTISTDDNRSPAASTAETSGSENEESAPQAKLASMARVELDHMNLRKLPVDSIAGWIQIEPGDEIPNSSLPAPPKLGLKNFTAKTAGGQVKLDGSIDMGKRSATFNNYFSNVNTDVLIDKMLGAPGELTGTMDGEIHLTSAGEDYKEILQNLQGTGAISVQNGVVARFGQLQTKITQANLLEQGLLGFNFNNLLQSMVPVRTGTFKKLSSKFSVYKGVLAVKELRYSGDDLRMWGAGKVNLPGDKMDLEIAGNIPRVTQSMLGGELGNLSRRITISKMLNKVTFGKLSNLPSLPLIGEIASDKPRTFSFKVDATASDAKQITHTIERSFKWLPNKQAASAHPVPGV